MERLTVDNETFFKSVLSVLKEGKLATIQVKGRSMLPFIVEGRDMVVLEGIEAGTPEGLPCREAKVGDAVLFRVGGKYILHRILRFREDGLAEIQGDGNVNLQEHCPRERIFGRVVTILKRGRRPVDVDSRPYLLKVRLWLLITPFRRIVLGVMRRLHLPW